MSKEDVARVVVLTADIIVLPLLLLFYAKQVAEMFEKQSSLMIDSMQASVADLAHKQQQVKC